MGRRLKRGDICILIADSHCCTAETQHCKTITHQFFKNSFSFIVKFWAFCYTQISPQKFLKQILRFKTFKTQHFSIQKPHSCQNSPPHLEEWPSPKSTNNKYWRGCGKERTLLYCWWECKLVQPLWKQYGCSLKKLK